MKDLEISFMRACGSVEARRFVLFRLVPAALLVTLVGQAIAEAAAHPGRIAYEKHCAVCHDNPEQSKARTFETLTRMIPGTIEYALTEGRMKAEAAALSETELEDLMNYFRGQTRSDNDWVANAMCADPTVDTKPPATVATFGFGAKNHRFLSEAQAGLAREDFENLELAWALAFPNITMMRSQPVVVGHTLFLTPVDSQQLYAFDISGSPCVRWVYDAEGPLRSSLTYGRLPASGRPVLVFGGMDGRLHMVSARTGERLWVRS